MAFIYDMYIYICDMYVYVYIYIHTYIWYVLTPIVDYPISEVGELTPVTNHLRNGMVLQVRFQNISAEFNEEPAAPVEPRTRYPG